MTCELLTLPTVPVPPGVSEAIEHIKSIVTTRNQLRLVRHYIEATIFGPNTDGAIDDVDDVLAYLNAHFSNRKQWVFLRVWIEICEHEGSGNAMTG